MTKRMSFCLKAATSLEGADLDQITASIEAYTQAGMPVVEAELAATRDLLAQIDGERAELVGLLREQFPGLFEPETEQYRNYAKAIAEGKVSVGMLEQIKADERLNDGEAERLIASAKPSAEPAPAAPAAPAPAAAPAEKKPSGNKVFTDDAAEKAREILRRRLGGGTLTSGIDPEILQAGITLAGWHLEKGARTFAAFSKAMLDDMGDMVKPYLKSWYAALYYDPRAAAMQAEMTPLDRLDEAAAAPAQPQREATAAPAPLQREQPLVEHVTKGGKGKTIRGVIRSDLTKEQAQAIDEYTFKKDGGWFIREKHLDALEQAHPVGAPPAPKVDNEALGREAFAAGADRVPPAGDMESMKAWLRGWDAANLAAPVPQAAGRSLVDTFYEAIKAGDMPGDNIALRKMVGEFDGGVAPTGDRMKQAQEALEAAIVRTARDTIARKQSTETTFDMLVRLYESQPALNIRTSTSIENQAYSTPAPLAYLASKLAGITPTTRAHEPTAGTGMLLIGAEPGLALVNELDQQRAELLRAQGFEVMTQDAATATVIAPGSADVVVTNPPFGPITESVSKPAKFGRRINNPDGSYYNEIIEPASTSTRNIKVKVDGYSIGQIDHLIAARALAGMKDDGRAVLILGANKMPGGMSNDDLVFFNWLRAHYNVASQFEVDGDLYRRQGAGWPVRVIVIDGRGPSADRNPHAFVQRRSDWKGVYEEFEKSLAAERRPERTGDQGQRADDAKPVPQPAAAAPAPADRGRSQGGAARTGNVPGERAGAVGDRGALPAEPVGAGAGGQRPAVQPAARPVERPAGGSAGRGTGVAGVARDPGLTQAENQFQAKYQPRSANQDKGILIPVNMAGPTQDALSALEDAVGDIDEFVRSELGYETIEDMHDGLMGLQVDSVAAAIYQTGRGKGVIIADQTGIGKGRQAAAIIRWAVRTKRIPVFVTVKPQLFTDMYGDLADIGSDDVQPFILNIDASIKGPGGDALFANKPGAHRRIIDRIAESGELPAGRNAVFMTYSQINVDNAQRRAINAIAPRAMFILDESHNAGGESNTGDFIKSVLEAAQGVTYLSATYAKRPDNMPVYFKTDIGEASTDNETLQAAMDAGGLPLQTVVSNNLVRAGQMFRRERSYDGVSIVTRADVAHRDEHIQLSDRTTEALRAIVNADRQFHDGYVKQLQKSLNEAGERVLDIAGNQAQASVNHTEFSSVVHNFVRQMLLGLKADEAANEAIASLKRGEKPLIALENTMGSFLSEYAEANGIKAGGSLGKFDYRTVLSRALTRTRFIVRQLPNGDKVREEVPLSVLDPDTREAYDRAQAVIDELNLTIPVSPIDWMRNKLAKAGYTVMEITGRDLAVDYSNEKKPVLTSVDALEQKDKVRTRDKFNGGRVEEPLPDSERIDALILNVAGSTGLSVHASERFADQRQRHMVIAQAAQDINIFMQMLGRIHRTGQVVLPKYTILNADLPAEKRPTALLSKKMKSLNANTSSNTESATSVQAADMLNKYGDLIVGQYLAENMELSRDLGIEDPMEGEETPMEDVARKATGRLALMPVAVQESFYAEVEQQYNDLIEYLNRTNQNELEPRTFDFEAREMRTAVLYEGQAKETPFGEDAIYGEYSIKAQGRPMTPDEINALMAEHLGGKTPADHARDLREQLRTGFLQARESASEFSRAVMEEGAGKVSTFINEHPIGSKWRVEINGDIYNAVITNLRNTHKGKGNPMTPSKMQVSIAVNGSLRSASMGMNQFRKIEVAQLHSDPVASLFSSRPSDERETAKIVTGNLLGAYGNMPNVRGTIVSFTKEDGSIEQGILLPKKFNFDKDVPKDFRLPNAAAALKFLQNSQNGDLARFGIMSRDSTIRAIPYRTGVTIQVPKSKARGGKYFLDPVLRDALGDFVSTGNVMRASTEDRVAAERAIAQVMKKTALYAVPSMADEARAITKDDVQLTIQEDFADTELPLPEVFESGPVRSDDAEAVARVHKTMRETGMKTLDLQPLPRPRMPDETASEMAKQRYWAAKMIEAVFGRRLIWFSANEPFANGLHSHAYPNALFVNEAMTRPVMGVLGHEMLHAMKRDNPELYAPLSDRILALLTDASSGYGTTVNKRRTDRNLPPLTEEKIREELIADIVGDNFTDPRFWRELAQGQDQGTFRRVLSLIRAFFDKVIAKLKNERPYGTDAYLSDVVAARDAVVQAMRAYAASPKATANAKALEEDFNLSADTGAFYSELERQVRDAPIKLAMAPAWKQYLRSRVGKGVKADEIEWSGVEQWLDLQPGRVGKQRMLEYIAANGVQVSEVVLGQAVDSTIQRMREERNSVQDRLDRLGFEMRIEYGEAILHKRVNGMDYVFEGGQFEDEDGEPMADTDAEARDLAMRYGRLTDQMAQYDEDGQFQGDRAKYAQYTLPGGTNYREVLLTLPTPASKGPSLGVPTKVDKSKSDYYADDPETDHILRYLGESVEISVRKDGKYHLILDRDEWVSNDLESLERRLAKWAASEGIPGATASDVFVSNHWEATNVIAHIRLNDRTDAEGKRVLFVEEIQSDWGQAGKRHGFKPRGDAAAVKMREADDLREQATVLEREMRAKVRAFREANPGAEQISDELHAWRKQQVDKISGLMQQHELAKAEAQELLGAQQSSSRVPQAPFVGKTDAWVSLALKRVIKMAVDEGYERVAFVTGEQSAERYDLSKHISEIHFDDNNTGGIGDANLDDPPKHGLLYANDMSGKRVMQQYIAPEKIEDYVGKEVARKLLEQKPKRMREAGLGFRRRSLSGLDLKVGGEGMRAFYDKIIPVVANEVLRKVGGGARMRTIDMTPRAQGGWRVELQPEGNWAILKPDGGIADMADTEAEARGAMADFSRGETNWSGRTEDQREPQAQLGFDVTPAMETGAAGGLPMFDLQDVKDPVLREAIRKSGTGGPISAGAKLRVYYQRATKALAGRWARTFQQGYLDQFTGIRLAVQNTLGGLPADQDPYVAARLANGGASSVMRGLLLHGQAKWADNGQHLEKIPGSEGLLDIFAPLGNDLNDFFRWMIGNRAARLMKEGRENNFTPEEIQALQDLGKGKEHLFRPAAAKFAAFKRSVLDIAEEAGLIDGEGRKVWDNADYIPFYREVDERAVFSATGKKGLAGQSSGIRQLRGGETELNDPMENIVMNFSRLIDASLKNNAIAKTVKVLNQADSGLLHKVGYDFKGAIIPADQVRKLLEQAGTPEAVLDVLPPEAFDGMAKMWALQQPQDPDVVRVMVKGKPLFYRVDDPLLLKALTSFVPFDFPGLAMARAFKRVLTAMVTATPTFWAANWIRDSLSAQMITRSGFNPLKSVQGIAKSAAETGGFEDMLFAGASFQSGQINAGDPEGTAKSMRRALRKRGMSAASADKFMSSLIDSPARAWEVYRHVGEAVENANREAVYEATLRKTNSVTAAAYEAKDLMDFTLRGSSPLYNLMSDVLPFFNARVQGMYRLGRADPKRVLALGALMALATVALAVANSGNPEYDGLDDWDKDLFWHIWVKGKQFRIPKPFELGVVFATIPERMFRYLMRNEAANQAVAEYMGVERVGSDSGKKFAMRVFSNLRDQLAINPVPQIIRPAVEVYFNHDSFRDRPIEPMKEEGLRAHMRYGPTTSDTARKVLETTAPVTDAIDLSPRKVEHLVRGYLGTIGEAVLSTADFAVRAMEGKPPGPKKRLDELPFVGRFYQESPPRSTVHTSDLYKLRDEVNAIYREVKALEKEGKDDKADALREKEVLKLALRKRLDKTARKLAGLNRQRDEVYADRELTPEQKRTRLDEILAERAELTREVMTSPDVEAVR